MCNKRGAHTTNTQTIKKSAISYRPLFSLYIFFSINVSLYSSLMYFFFIFIPIKLPPPLSLIPLSILPNGKNCNSPKRKRKNRLHIAFQPGGSGSFGRVGSSFYNKNKTFFCCSSFACFVGCILDVCGVRVCRITFF